METNENAGTKSATGWLIATFIFAILGGLLGLAFGIVVYRNREYKDTHRKLGLLGAILSAISFAVWKFSVL